MPADCFERPCGVVQRLFEEEQVQEPQIRERQGKDRQRQEMVCKATCACVLVYSRLFQPTRLEC